MPLRARLSRAAAASAGRHSRLMTCIARCASSAAMKPLPVPISSTRSWRCTCKFLQQAGFDLGLQHGLAVTQRHLGVDEGQGLQRRWHEVFTAHRGQQRQHGLVQHLPGADLLLDHVEAGEFGVHA